MYQCKICAEDCDAYAVQSVNIGREYDATANKLPARDVPPSLAGTRAWHGLLYLFRRLDALFSISSAGQRCLSLSMVRYCVCRQRYTPTTSHQSAHRGNIPRFHLSAGKRNRRAQRFAPPETELGNGLQHRQIWGVIFKPLNVVGTATIVTKTLDYPPVRTTAGDEAPSSASRG